jgi:hypothetical protein
MTEIGGTSEIDGIHANNPPQPEPDKSPKLSLRRLTLCLVNLIHAGFGACGTGKFGNAPFVDR